MDMAIRTRWVATLIGGGTGKGHTTARLIEALRRALKPERAADLWR
jgi:hypothetical protein